LIKQSVTLALLAGATTLVNVLFQWYVITHLGVGIETDALFAGMAVPQFIVLVMSSTLPPVLVPILATDDEGTFRQNAWGFFIGVTGIFTLLAVAMFATAVYWVPLLVPGFSDPARTLAISLTRIQLVNMVFTASLSILWGVHRARHKFIWVELSALLSGALALALLVPVLRVYGIAGATLLLVVETGLQMICLLPGLGRWQRPDWGSAAMREAWRRIRPLLLGMTYLRTDLLTDRLLASMAPAGGLSLLNLGQQIYGVANVIAEKAISIPMAPKLATEASSQKWSEFKHSYHRRLLVMGGMALSGYAVLMIAGERILNLVIGHGGVTRANVHLLWQIMAALGGFFIAGSMGLITWAGFYAMGDTRTPTWVWTITYTLYIPAKVVAFLRFGLIGLGAMTSAYLFLNLGIQIFLLEKFAIPKRLSSP
jgi:putative peptidoglycan lipid II flippase